MSDFTPPGHWQPDPLLRGQAGTPHFLRNQWDNLKATPFGPWRVNEYVDPASGQSAAANAPGEAEALIEPAPEAVAEILPAAAQPAPRQGPTDEEVAAIRASAFAEGQAAGHAEAMQKLAAERASEGAVLRHLAIELRALQQDPQRFFEPLKRLALHLAEQIVRGELQVSGKVVADLVRQSLAQLDHATDSVIVSLHPADLQRLQALGEASEGMSLEAAPELLPGSVRVRVNDTLVEDLIEHRVAAIARRLLAAPEAWLAGQSTLLHPDASPAMPRPGEGDERKPAWPRPVIEATDAEIIPAGDAENPPAAAPETPPAGNAAAAAREAAAGAAATSPHAVRERDSGDA